MNFKGWVCILILTVVWQSSTFATGQELITTCDGGPFPIHLTFDDGPHASLTPKVLNILKQYGVSATFFINTSRMGTSLNWEKLLRRAHEEGHIVGFHTSEHIRHTDLSISEDKIIENLSRVPDFAKPYMSKVIRFPYGSGWFKERGVDVDERRRWLMSTVEEMGFLHVGWDIDTWDWSKDLRRHLPESLHYQICRQQGGIVLMHDIQSFTAENLAEKIILPILAAGHRFVDLQTIMHLNRSRVEPWPSLSREVVGVGYCFGKSVRSGEYIDQVKHRCADIEKYNLDVLTLQ